MDTPGFTPRPQHPKISVCLRVPSDRLKKIDALAARHGMTRSAFINQCIDYALKALSTDYDHFNK